MVCRLHLRGAHPQQTPSALPVERLPPGVSYSHADNLDRTAASMHDLRRRVASPPRTRTINISIVKPCASKIASVQPCDKPASKLSARRWSALSSAFRVLIALRAGRAFALRIATIYVLVSPTISFRRSFDHRRLVRAARVTRVTDLSVRVSGQESENEPRNLVILLIQSEMAGIEQMDLGIWQIALESLCPRSNERGIVPSPDHQSRRLVFAQPRLPRRI
jgi:hypothetical protein